MAHPCIVISIQRLSPDKAVTISAIRPETPVYDVSAGRMVDTFTMVRGRVREAFRIVTEAIPKPGFSIAIERTCDEVGFMYFSAKDGAFLTKEGYRIIVKA